MTPWTWPSQKSAAPWAIESPLLEAVRQLSLKLGPNNAAFVHLTYVPFIAAAGELKTKPTQHTVQKAAKSVSSPTPCSAAPTAPFHDDERAKISLFTNVPEWGVISMWDVDTIYKVPRMLHEQGLDGLICDKLRLNTPHQPQALGCAGLRNRASPGRGTMPMVGKYVDLSDSYKSVNGRCASHRHAEPCAREIDHDSETITPEGVASLGRYDAILVPAALASAAWKAKISTARYARTQDSGTSASAWACR